MAYDRSQIHVYAGAETGGIFRKAVGETQWQAVNHGLPQAAEVRAIAVRPGQPEIVFAGTQEGPYRSVDGGDTWERLDFPGPERVVWSFAFHPQDARVMYCGTAPGAVFRSQDGGDHWRRLPTDLGGDVVRMEFPTRTIAMAANPAHPDHLYVALEVGGVIRSLDGGESWQAVNNGLAPNVGLLDLHGVQISPAQPDTVFISVRAGLLRSRDQGEHWEPIDLRPFSQITYCRDLRVAPSDPRTLYVSLGQAARSAEGALYRSRDLGASWERVDRGLTPKSTMMAVALTARQPTCVYCCTRDGEVFGTHDGGAAWQTFPLPAGTQEVRALACG
jgi:photosystem II stability/assembly factor-like uncharacterized protein